MDSISAEWGVTTPWSPDHLMLMATICGVIAVMAINAAAMVWIYATPRRPAAKHLLLAAIWAAPGAALAVWALRGVRSTACDSPSQGRSAER